MQIKKHIVLFIIYSVVVAVILAHLAAFILCETSNGNHSFEKRSLT